MNETENNDISTETDSLKDTEETIKETDEEISQESSADDNENNVNEAEDFGYIVPEKTFKQKQKDRHKHKKSRRHRHHSKTITHDDDGASTTDFVFSRPRRKHRKHRKHMKKGTKILIIVLSIVLGLIIAVGGSVLILNEIGNRQMHSLNSDDLDITPPEKVDDGSLDVIASDNGEIIKYNGHEYRLNKNIATILFMGLDQETTEAANENADAIYLMAIDTSAKTINVLSISRETMCDVDVYDSEGRFVENKNMQVCLAFGYGTTPNERCENVRRSVSRYLYNIPLSSYFAIDLTCIPTLNDEVGGVSVISNFEFVSPEDGRTVKEGESLILHGKEAERYVRERSMTGLDANAKRMERQQQYLKGFMASVIPAAKKNVSVITDLYSTITDHSITDLTLPKITYLATTALSMVSNADDINFVGIEGETTYTGKNNEFRPNDKALLETVLKLFYNQVG